VARGPRERRGERLKSARVSSVSFRDQLDVVLARGRFGHREHLELAWRYLRGGDLPRARRQMSAAIRHVARSHGEPDRYHHTITLAWLHLVAVDARRSRASTFDEFIAANPELLTRDLLDHHFSGAALAGARRAWVEPDLLELPPVG
jgi:hypothetical protein